MIIIAEGEAGSKLRSVLRLARQGDVPFLAAFYEIDMLVAYIVPEDVWYIFPPSAFGTMGGINIFTQGKRTTKYEPYREAWHIFSERVPV